MEEDITILELVLKYYDKDTSYGNKLLKGEKQALENVINRLKEDEAVIKEMVEHIASSAIVDDMVCMYKDCDIEECDNNIARECTEQYFRKKVKDERNKV